MALHGIDGKTSGNRDRLYFFGSKITADGDCSQERRQGYPMEKRQPLQVLLGKLVNHLSKNETRTLSNTIHKNKLKMG